jgi:predicted nuclease of predicted toxin-antitoxin system
VATFLVDEDLPRSLAPQLRSAGFNCEDVRDLGLRARPDEHVAAYAQTHGHVVVTRDLGFVNLYRRLSSSHPGLVVVRFPSVVTISTVNEAIAAGLRALADTDVTGNTVVVEPGRVRLRRPSAGQPPE